MFADHAVVFVFLLRHVISPVRVVAVCWWCEQLVIN